ncbi:MAG TPA: Wzt carbohydrate-binding domain-containing protein, partial [Candidatus Limnocylindrales bacterium]|nr:Wzt carbohydrate-binding domain-containing protein [Candidatus Limnocylindrales bacterium]
LKNYSSGMQVRLAFSIAIQAQSDILVLDEVLAVGDANFQRKCFEYFNLLKNSGTTVIFVSHDNAAVERYCNRALLLEYGEPLGIDKPSIVFDKYLESNIKKLETVKKKVKTTEVEKKGTEKADFVELIAIDSESKKTKSVFRPYENITIRATIKAKCTLKNLVIRVVLQHASGGAAVCGFSTKQEGVKLGTIKEGATISVEFCFENRFNDAEFVLHSTCFDEDQKNLLARMSSSKTISSLGWTRDLRCEYYPDVTVSFS